MIINLYKNQDNIDDFMSLDLEIKDIGEAVYKYELLGWKLDPDEHLAGEMMWILSLKSDYLYDIIINKLNDAIYELSKIGRNDCE